MEVSYAEVQGGKRDHGKEEEGKSAKSLCVRFVKEEEEEEHTRAMGGGGGDAHGLTFPLVSPPP